MKTYLVSKGVDGSKIRTQGKGLTQPITDNRTAQGRAQNGASRGRSPAPARSSLMYGAVELVEQMLDERAVLGRGHGGDG